MPRLRGSRPVTSIGQLDSFINSVSNWAAASHLGQNLRYLFGRDYHPFERLLRVTGGTGFWPIVIWNLPWFFCSQLLHHMISLFRDEDHLSLELLHASLLPWGSRVKWFTTESNSQPLSSMPMSRRQDVVKDRQWFHLFFTLNSSAAPQKDLHGHGSVTLLRW